MRQLEQNAASALNQVLETMFYETAEPVNTEVSPGFDYLCSVEFEGETRGQLQLRLTRGLVTSLANNFYGEGEEELTEDKLSDVARELTNMVGGSFLALSEELLGPMSFGVPEVSPIDGSSERESRLPVRVGVRFEVDSELLELHVLGLKGVDGD